MSFGRPTKNHTLELAAIIDDLFETQINALRSHRATLGTLLSKLHKNQHSRDAYDKNVQIKEQLAKKIQNKDQDMTAAQSVDVLAEHAASSNNFADSSSSSSSSSSSNINIVKALTKQGQISREMSKKAQRRQQKLLAKEEKLRNKDPNAPVRIRSAYHIFMKDRRQVLKEQGIIAQQAVIQIAADWRSASAEVRDQYQQAFLEACRTHEVELQNYEAGKGKEMHALVKAAANMSEGQDAFQAAQDEDSEGPDDDEEEEDEDSREAASKKRRIAYL
jgi:hypothetical protein